MGAMKRQIWAELALQRENMGIVMGMGGRDLRFFHSSFEGGFDDVQGQTIEYPYGADKKEAPDIKRVNRQSILVPPTDDDAVNQTNTTNSSGKGGQK